MSTIKEHEKTAYSADGDVEHGLPALKGGDQTASNDEDGRSIKTLGEENLKRGLSSRQVSMIAIVSPASHSSGVDCFGLSAPKRQTSIR